jgi:hypothetical protein
MVNIGIARTKLEEAFLRALAEDMKDMGHRLKCESRSDGSSFELIGQVRSEGAVGEDEGRRLRDAQAARSIANDPGSFRQLEARFYESYFSKLKGIEIEMDKIDPRLQVETVSRDNVVFRYASYYQDIRSLPGVGNPILLTLWDRAHGDALMGVMAFGYPAYFQGDRDFFLKWRNPTFSAESKQTRSKGLKRIAQISYFLAIPPYIDSAADKRAGVPGFRGRLRVSRLLSQLAFSGEVQAAFRKSRDEPLLSLVCTAALRAHVAPFQAERSSNGPALPGSRRAVYRKIEVPLRKRHTCFEVISATTKEAASALLQHSRYGASEVADGAWKRALSYAMRATCLPNSILETNHVATYIGYLESGHVEALRFLRKANPMPLSTTVLLNDWKSEIHAAGLKVGEHPRLTIANPKTLLASEGFRLRAKSPRA